MKKENARFYSKAVMIPNNEFVTPAAAFAAYLAGGLLLFAGSRTGAFLLLSLGVTVNILDAYTFPILNRLSGRRKSIIFGSPGKRGETESPGAVFFLSPSPGNEGRKKKRALYRIGFLGGATLFLSSIARLIVIDVHPLAIAAGSALAVVGLFSRGLYRDESVPDSHLQEKLETVVTGLTGDRQFRSWVVVLTESHSQTRAFLSRYRRYLLGAPCIFLCFSERRGERECSVPGSLGTLTGYRTHSPLASAIAQITADAGLLVSSEKRGIDLNCLCALARGFRAASITFSTRIQAPLLLDILLKTNALNYKQEDTG